LTPFTPESIGPSVPGFAPSLGAGADDDEELQPVVSPAIQNATATTSNNDLIGSISLSQ